MSYNPNMYGSVTVSGGVASTTWSAGYGLGAQAIHPQYQSMQYYQGFCNKHNQSYVTQVRVSADFGCPDCQKESEKSKKEHMKFKIGDKVVPTKRNGCGIDATDFTYLVITGVQGSYSYVAYDANDNHLGSCIGCYGDDNLELIESKTMNSGKVGGNALSRLAKSLFNGRVKKFIEVGFLTSDLEVTEKFTRSAMAIVMEDLLSQKKDDATAVELTVSEVGRRLEAQADEEIQEAKDEKNCCKN